MGGEVPKQFRVVAGRPVLMRTIEAFHRYDSAIGVILVLPDAHRDYWAALCREYAFAVPHTVVSGGETRFHSVRNGVRAVPGEVRLIAVHDGVRPFVSCRLLIDTFATADVHGVAVPAVPVVDSLRRVTTEGNEAVSRAEYRSVQTPQVFCAEILREAYRQPYNDTFTDDASVAEAAGYAVTLVEGDTDNIKITSPRDMVLAEMLCAHE